MRRGAPDCHTDALGQQKETPPSVPTSPPASALSSISPSSKTPPAKKAKRRTGEKPTSPQGDDGSRLRARSGSSFSLFPHQVAGHGGIRMFGDGRLIKPAIPQEVAFYENLVTLPFLKPFLPTFHGFVDLRDASQKIPAPVETPSSRPPEKPLGKNRYIILEDISCRFGEPCVLDLKMGTRHYAETADREKKARSIRKCRESTSSALGFRVCGMQVYHERTSQFLRRDKSYGRKLTHDTVDNSLRLFLWDGERLRLDLVPHFLSSLRELVGVISRVPDYRFYSSSLLLIYDGISRSINVDLRIIDFAKTYLYRGKGPDSGFLLGLNSLISCFERILKDGSDGDIIYTLKDLEVCSPDRGLRELESETSPDLSPSQPPSDVDDSLSLSPQHLLSTSPDSVCSNDMLQVAASQPREKADLIVSSIKTARPTSTSTCSSFSG